MPLSLFACFGCFVVCPYVCMCVCVIVCFLLVVVVVTAAAVVVGGAQRGIPCVTEQFMLRLIKTKGGAVATGDVAVPSTAGTAFAGGAAGARRRPAIAPPLLLLAQTYTAGRDIVGWWLSEKLDGVRAFWNGKEFVSRAGNVFDAPSWFTKALPDHALDGELWGGRGRWVTFDTIPYSSRSRP